MTKHFFKIMIPRKTGRIINIASVAGKAGQPFNSSYAASKHGILGLTKTVALEMGILGVPGITVNAICPGAVKTDMLEGEDGLFEYPSKTRGINREEAAKFVTGLNLQDRMLGPEEVAGLALYLASNEAKGITGQAINIDAGQIMH